MLDSVSISVASRDVRRDALRLVFQVENPDEEALSIATGLLDEGLVLGNGLLIARRNGQLVGAVWGQFMPGNTAIVWPPRLEAGEPEETASELLTTLAGLLEPADISMAHAILGSRTDVDARRLESIGMRYETDMLYLSAPREFFPVTAPEGELAFVPFADEFEARLTALVDATYEETRDLPILNGARTTTDVLAGYRETGDFSPERWQIVRHADRDVGCLLLTDHPGLDQWELVYMGLVPGARGCGWGDEIVQYALWLCGQSTRSQLVLAVDAANDPAIAVYSRAGFTEWDRRSVFLRVYGPKS